MMSAWRTSRSIAADATETPTRRPRGTPRGDRRTLNDLRGETLDPDQVRDDGTGSGAGTLDMRHVTLYIIQMIKSFADRKTQRLYAIGKAKHLPPDLWDAAESGKKEIERIKPLQAA